MADRPVHNVPAHPASRKLTRIEIHRSRLIQETSERSGGRRKGRNRRRESFSLSLSKHVANSSFGLISPFRDAATFPLMKVLQQPIFRPDIVSVSFQIFKRWPPTSRSRIRFFGVGALTSSVPTAHYLRSTEAPNQTGRRRRRCSLLLDLGRAPA